MAADVRALVACVFGESGLARGQRDSKISPTRSPSSSPSAYMMRSKPRPSQKRLDRLFRSVTRCPSTPGQSAWDMCAGTWLTATHGCNKHSTTWPWMATSLCADSLSPFLRSDLGLLLRRTRSRTTTRHWPTGATKQGKQCSRLQ